MTRDKIVNGGVVIRYIESASSVVMITDEETAKEFMKIMHEEDDESSKIRGFDRLLKSKIKI